MVAIKESYELAPCCTPQIESDAPLDQVSSFVVRLLVFWDSLWERSLNSRSVAASARWKQLEVGHSVSVVEDSKKGLRDCPRFRIVQQYIFDEKLPTQELTCLPKFKQDATYWEQPKLSTLKVLLTVWDLSSKISEQVAWSGEKLVSICVSAVYF